MCFASTIIRFSRKTFVSSWFKKLNNDSKYFFDIQLKLLIWFSPNRARWSCHQEARRSSSKTLQPPTKPPLEAVEVWPIRTSSRFPAPRSCCPSTARSSTTSKTFSPRPPSLPPSSPRRRRAWTTWACRIPRRSYQRRRRMVWRWGFISEGRRTSTGWRTIWRSRFCCWRRPAWIKNMLCSLEV